MSNVELSFRPDRRTARPDDAAQILETAPRLLEHLPIAMYACDRAGRILWFNRRAAELWGRAPTLGEEAERFCGSYKLYFDGHEIAREECPMAFVLRTGTPVHSVEGRIGRPDGSYVWATVHIDPIRDSAGQLIGAINCFHETTAVHAAAEELQHAQHALSERDQRLAATYEHAGIAISEVDAEGRLLRVNETVCAITGYAREELLGKTVFEVTHPADRPSDHEAYGWQASGRTDSYAAEKRLTCKDGRVIWVSVTSSTVRGADGRFLYGIRVMQDITARKRNEDMRRENERHLRALIEALPAAVYTTDADGRITFYNKAAVALWGREPDCADSQWCGSWRLYRPDGRPMRHDECPMAVALKRGESVHGAEVIAERPDGSRVPFIPYPTVLRDDPGKIVGAVNMLVDITERKSAEERQKALIDELNHRVKNTLATVQSLAAQTIRGSGLPANMRETFNARLFALSRAHDQLSREHWESADLKCMLSEILAPYSADDADRVRLDGAAIRLPPRGSLMLAMVVHELATNAAKYGSLSVAGGVLDVSWRVAQNGVGPVLNVDWRESGGPAVKKPSRRGFGSRLAERAIAYELGGKAQIDFDKAGVQCRFQIPLCPPGA